jgi:hypothetical protein
MHVESRQKDLLPRMASRNILPPHFCFLFAKLRLLACGHENNRDARRNDSLNSFGNGKAVAGRHGDIH